MVPELKKLYYSIEGNINPLGVNDRTSLDEFSDSVQPTFKITPTATSENLSSLQISSFKLNGQNFLSWSRSVQLVIRGKGKMGFLDGSLPQPALSDPAFPDWDINNSIVISWLINSMDT